MFQPRDMKKLWQRIAQSGLEIHVSELCPAHSNHLFRSRQESSKIYKQLSRSVNYYLKAVNSHRFRQSDLDTRSWYHGTAASMECLQPPLCIPSSPGRSRLIPFALDYTRLARTKPNQEPVRRLSFD